MIINRIKRNLFNEYLLCGKTCAEVQNNFLPINEINKISEAVASENVLCVIYDDIPLLTMKTVKFLFSICKQGEVGFSLGDGFIKTVGYNGSLQQVCTEETEKYLPNRYSYFLKKINESVLEKHKNNGVIICDDDTIFIDFEAKISSGAIIRPFVSIKGETYIGKGTLIGENSVLENAEIGDNSKVLSSRICDSQIGDCCSIGPFAFIRDKSCIGNSCRIGDYVEIKNSRVADGAKASHLAYIGDAFVGEKTNVGCGTVFCNYDGKTKNHSVVGRDVFIGANVNLIAPIKIDDGVFIAAGSTVTKDVPSNSFVIARVKQSIKELH